SAATTPSASTVCVSFAFHASPTSTSRPSAPLCVPAITTTFREGPFGAPHRPLSAWRPRGPHPHPLIAAGGGPTVLQDRAGLLRDRLGRVGLQVDHHDDHVDAGVLHARAVEDLLAHRERGVAHVLDGTAHLDRQR